MDTFLRILFMGPQWHGSDSAGLARAFRRLGHIVQTVDQDAFFPSGISIPLKVVRKIFRPLFRKEFNNKIINEAKYFQPQLCIVPKGDQVDPQTLLAMKSRGIFLALFYPDVSYFVHGPRIPKCLPLYDHIFTTKSFGVADLQEKMNITSAEFLPHGFDQDIHRKLLLDKQDLELMGSDAAFIGTWSPKKERFMAKLAESLPQINLRIWGNQWGKSTQSVLESYIEGRGIVGDIYPLAIQASKINIVVLSEIRCGASSGDNITVKTFEIPASGGFMLHERTEELLEYFREGEEIACFGSPEELADKVRYYLEHEEKRERIRLAGYRRCIAENNLEQRAIKIMDYCLKHIHVGRTA